MNMKFSAPCIFGLEGLCANELRYLGVEMSMPKTAELPLQAIGQHLHLQI